MEPPANVEMVTSLAGGKSKYQTHGWKCFPKSQYQL